MNNNRYQSPMRSCQKQSYLVVITDGVPFYDNDYDSLLRSELALKTGDRFDDSYLPGVAEWMQTRDVNPNLLGQQNIVTYTIGFSQGADDAADLLAETATRGGGQYYAASDALALQGSLQQIFSEILAVNATFTLLPLQQTATTAHKHLMPFTTRCFYPLIVLAGPAI
jgi:type IV pilus assembly protein PilY1